MTPVLQRGEGDCAAAAMAALLHQAYEDVYLEVAAVDPVWRGKRGLYNREVVSVAKRLGVTLAPTRRFDLEYDSGILRVRPRIAASPLYKDGHFVALDKGRVVCPLFRRSHQWEEYFETVHAKPCTLLKVIA